MLLVFYNGSTDDESIEESVPSSLRGSDLVFVKRKESVKKGTLYKVQELDGISGLADRLSDKVNLIKMIQFNRKNLGYYIKHNGL